MKAAVQQNLKCQHLHIKHVECQPARMKKDRQAVHDLQASMHDFDADPFCIFSPSLRSLQFGLGALPTLVHDSQDYSKLAKFKLKPCIKGECSLRQNLSLQLSTKIKGKLLHLSNYTHHQVQSCRWSSWRSGD